MEAGPPFPSNLDKLVAGLSHLRERAQLKHLDRALLRPQLEQAPPRFPCLGMDIWEGGQLKFLDRALLDPRFLGAA